MFSWNNIFIGLTTLWILSIMPVIIHELGHAPSSHIMGVKFRGWIDTLLGMPAAFVETTDIWLEPPGTPGSHAGRSFTGLILAGGSYLHDPGSTTRL
jgi:hypothetical protein